MENTSLTAAIREGISLDDFRALLEANLILMDQRIIFRNRLTTAFHEAVVANRLDLVQLLIENGTKMLDEHMDPEISNRSMISNRSITAVDIATPEMLKLLLQLGANPMTTRDPTKRGSPIYMAALNGRNEILKILIIDGHCPIDCLGMRRRTPLHAAALYHKIATVEFLLELGSQAFNQADGDGMTLPHLIFQLEHKKETASKGMEKLAKLAFYRHLPLDLDSHAHLQETPISLALEHWDLDGVQMLLALGARSNLLSINVSNGIHEFVIYGAEIVIRLKIEEGWILKVRSRVYFSHSLTQWLVDSILE